MSIDQKILALAVLAQAVLGKNHYEGERIEYTRAGDSYDLRYPRLSERPCPKLETIR